MTDTTAPSNWNVVAVLAACPFCGGDPGCCHGHDNEDQLICRMYCTNRDCIASHLADEGFWMRSHIPTMASDPYWVNAFQAATVAWNRRVK